MSEKNEPVDYLDLMARAEEEERKDDWSAMLPEPQGEKAVDYLAVAAAWEVERARRREE